MVERVTAVVIGRNEGERLVRSLASLVVQDINIVYVDSGSNDASVEEARKVGAEVLELDLSVPFTAARARMAGFGVAKRVFPNTEFVQFVDGDCEIDHGWIAAGCAALDADEGLAVVFGHQYEKFPEATIYNRLIHEEWANAPVGPAKACGGNALMRVAALDDVGGYREDLIAGEEPEMCYRMRQKGWRIERIDAAMARHDADLTRFSQWWQRSRRAGHTYAEGVATHGSGPEQYRKTELRRSLLWGLAIPVGVLFAALLITPWALLLLLIYPLQVLRLARRMPLRTAFFLTLGKFPETHGALGYWAGRLAGVKRRKLIEYK
jgi:GT2 family glycosyltransferase